MSRDNKVKLISAYNYYKTMVQFYGVSHARAKSALLILIRCYRADFKPKNEGLKLIKGFESEDETTVFKFDNDTVVWEDLT